MHQEWNALGFFFSLKGIYTYISSCAAGLVFRSNCETNIDSHNGYPDCSCTIYNNFLRELLRLFHILNPWEKVFSQEQLNISALMQPCRFCYFFLLRWKTPFINFSFWPTLMLWHSNALNSFFKFSSQKDCCLLKMQNKTNSATLEIYWIIALKSSVWMKKGWTILRWWKSCFKKILLEVSLPWETYSKRKLSKLVSILGGELVLAI